MISLETINGARYYWIARPLGSVEKTAQGSSLITMTFSTSPERWATRAEELDRWVKLDESEQMMERTLK